VLHFGTHDGALDEPHERDTRKYIHICDVLESTRPSASTVVESENIIVSRGRGPDQLMARNRWLYAHT
jgi:ABC-type uncharacterized transport system auxiliary subunit